MANHEAVELDQPGRIVLAAALREGPESVMTIHLLRRGLAKAVVVGSLERPLAVVVQPYGLPAEPTAHGEDAAAIWAALRTLDGWTCVNAPIAVAPALAAEIAATTGRGCEPIEEIYYPLDRPVAALSNPAARLLGARDAPLVAAAADRLGNVGWRFGNVGAMLDEGIVAGVVIDGRLVAVAYTSAVGDRFAEVGVATREEWRGRGLSTATAALVCHQIQRLGQIPVWSTSADNAASRRVATKLGFVEASRRVYLDPA